MYTFLACIYISLLHIGNHLHVHSLGSLKYNTFHFSTNILILDPQRDLFLKGSDRLLLLLHLDQFLSIRKMKSWHCALYFHFGSPLSMFFILSDADKSIGRRPLLSVSRNKSGSTSRIILTMLS